MYIAEEEGENGSIVEEAFHAVYYFWDSVYKIPCYAELAIYNNTEIWILFFNRANGGIGPAEHFDCYFVSIPYLEQHQITEYNSTAIIHYFGCR